MPLSSSCEFVLTIRFSIHALQFGFIGTRVLFYAHHLALILPLVGEFLAPLDLHVQILGLNRDGLSVDQSGAAIARLPVEVLSF